MYTIFCNIHTGCCKWTGRLLLDSAQRPGNLKLKYVNHLAVYIRWDQVRPWSQRVLRPPWVCVTLLDLRTTQHCNLYPGCMKREGVKVSVFATDRSTSVRCVSFQYSLIAVQMNFGVPFFDSHSGVCKKLSKPLSLNFKICPLH